MQIRNSIFLVTGGASGLGAASARMAAENGAKVWLPAVEAFLGEYGVPFGQPKQPDHVIQTDAPAPSDRQRASNLQKVGG